MDREAGRSDPGGGFFDLQGEDGKVMTKGESMKKRAASRAASGRDRIVKRMEALEPGQNFVLKFDGEFFIFQLQESGVEDKFAVMSANPYDAEDVQLEVSGSEAGDVVERWLDRYGICW